ncbi:MFS transporter [Anaerovibrio sp.]|uniref:MFS transporter n=1 Tax=Anaerovibrio sp. TaxID=1872532 RepID=UPI003F146A44
MLLERLEKLPVGSFHYKLLAVTGLGWLFDAMDTGLISFVLPILAKDWGLAPEQMGWIGSVGFIGMALGAVISGTIADRIGRKLVFSLTVVLYSLATGACALSWNYESLLIFRFLVGFGLGGELPVAATLMTEYAPTKLRGRFIVLLESFWGLGWLAAACIAYLLIPQYGWQIAFFIGALPAVYVFMIRLHMPESVRYLISKGRIGEAQEIVLMLEKKLHVASAPFDKELSDVEKGTSTVAEPKFSSLWSGMFARRTLMLWLAWFGINFSYYGIFMWLPSIVFQQGFTVVKTFEYVLIMTLAQLPGYYCAAWLVDVIGRKYTLSLFLLISGVASYFFGNAATPGELLAWGAAMSFFNLGAWGVLYTYTPELYPTAIRALGSGWAAGFGRIGSMIAPAMVGMMIGSQMSSSGIFMLFAGVFLAVSLIVVCLGVESRQKSLEEIADEAAGSSEALAARG